MSSRFKGPVAAAAAWIGIALAGSMLAWFVAGFVPGIPSMVDVFGVPGMRTPAAIAVGGLLLAAIGFWDF